MYSLPTRDGNLHDYESIQLRDLRQPQQNEPPQNQPPQYQMQQTQSAALEETRKKCKKYKVFTCGLGVLLGVAFITLLVLGLLYGKSTQAPQSPGNSTVFTSVVTTTTSISGKASTITQTLPALTQTLPPVTQTAITTETEVSHITDKITQTSVLTTTDTTRITVTPTKDPHDGNRCSTNQQYGGHELHDINDDYDLLLADAVQESVDSGMYIGDAEVLEVADRSVFMCLGSHSIDLLEACKLGFARSDGDVSCISGASYPIPVQVTTETTTSVSTHVVSITATTSPRRRIMTKYWS